MVKGGYVYIMTNKPFGILYTGVTADIAARVTAHREGRGSAFCRKWGLKRVVFIEQFPTIEEAIVREKAIKNWTRLWKLRAIAEVNQNWTDLYDDLMA